MVKGRGKSVRRTFLIVIAATLLAAEAPAAVTAWVDRSDIDLNESFRLDVISDTNIDSQPDVSVLDQDFYIGRSSQLSNTTIINGQMRRSKTWSYVLMPRRAGRLTIPPISVGNESSAALVITVSEPSYAPPGEAEVFITSEVDFAKTYVQAQVLLTIKIFSSVVTRRLALGAPEFGGAEVLVEMVGDDRNYDAVINGTNYSVIERVYAIFPQESGQMQISPARFEARILRNGRITARKVFESEPQSISVLPIPAPPAEYPDAVWLPAKDVQISESWSRDTDEVTAGEPLTRHVTTTALGQLETQIPAFEPPSAAGLNIYPDKPELTRRIESGGIRGVRQDRYAVIGVSAGVAVLPAIRVPWWNIETGQWQVASLPERAITILASAEQSMPEPDATEPVAAGNKIEPTAQGTAIDSFWQLVSELLAVLWLLTLVAWWWSTKPRSGPRKPSAPLPHQLQAKYLKAARKAALVSEGANVRQALLDWGRLQWPENVPRSIGEIARRVSSPLAEELRNLSSLSYGPNGGDWNGEAMAKAIGSFSVLKDDAKQTKELLPPLMPTS